MSDQVFYFWVCFGNLGFRVAVATFDPRAAEDQARTHYPTETEGRLVTAIFEDVPRWIK